MARSRDEIFTVKPPESKSTRPALAGKKELKEITQLEA